MLCANYNTNTHPTNAKSQVTWTAKTKAKWNQNQKPWAKWSQVKPSEAKWSQVKPSEAKWSQVKPSEAKWSQVKPSEAKWSQVKPKAKWARKWEILAPKCMQNTDFSSKMQQIARKAAPGCKTKKKSNQKKIYPPSWNLRCCRVQSRYRRWLSSIPASEALPAGLHHSGAPGARLWRKATAISMGMLWERKYMNISFLVGVFFSTPLKNDGVPQLEWWNLIIPFPINYGKVIIHSMVPVTTNQVSLDFSGKEYAAGMRLRIFERPWEDQNPIYKTPRAQGEMGMYMDVALETKGMAKTNWKSTGCEKWMVKDLQNADPSLGVTFWWARPISPQCLCPTKLPSMASQKSVWLLCKRCNQRNINRKCMFFIPTKDHWSRPKAQQNQNHASWQPGCHFFGATFVRGTVIPTKASNQWWQPMMLASSGG